MSPMEKVRRFIRDRDTTDAFSLDGLTDSELRDFIAACREAAPIGKDAVETRFIAGRLLAQIARAVSRGVAGETERADLLLDEV